MTSGVATTPDAMMSATSHARSAEVGELHELGIVLDRSNFSGYPT
jgi:hypothetical protein